MYLREIKCYARGYQTFGGLHLWIDFLDYFRSKIAKYGIWPGSEALICSVGSQFWVTCKCLIGEAQGVHSERVDSLKPNANRSQHSLFQILHFPQQSLCKPAPARPAPTKVIRHSEHPTGGPWELPGGPELTVPFLAGSVFF